MAADSDKHGGEQLVEMRGLTEKERKETEKHRGKNISNQLCDVEPCALTGADFVNIIDDPAPNRERDHPHIREYGKAERRRRRSVRGKRIHQTPRASSAATRCSRVFTGT